MVQEAEVEQGYYGGRYNEGLAIGAGKAWLALGRHIHSQESHGLWGLLQVRQRLAL